VQFISDGDSLTGLTFENTITTDDGYIRHLWGQFTITANVNGGGNVYIGDGSTRPLLKLSTDSAFKPGGGSWTSTSDARLKEDVTDADLDICYNNVKTLPLKYYKWKDNVISESSLSDVHKLGWLAQDVRRMLPKSVSVGENYGLSDCLSLNNDSIYACMYGAIQKLMQNVESQACTIQQQALTIQQQDVIIQQQASAMQQQESAVQQIHAIVQQQESTIQQQASTIQQHELKIQQLFTMIQQVDTAVQ